MIFSRLSILIVSCIIFLMASDQIRSVAQLCPTLCDPMNLSMPGLPVHHQLPEFTETQSSIYMVACGILVPQPGIESTLPALKVSVLTTGSPGKSPNAFLTYLICNR